MLTALGFANFLLPLASTDEPDLQFAVFYLLLLNFTSSPLFHRFNNELVCPAAAGIPQRALVAVN